MDCSVTKRKGCNYCLRYKDITAINSEAKITIDDEKRILEVSNDSEEIWIDIKINYCPICGKEL